MKTFDDLQTERHDIPTTFLQRYLQAENHAREQGRVRVGRALGFKKYFQ